MHAGIRIPRESRHSHPTLDVPWHHFFILRNKQRDLPPTAPSRKFSSSSIFSSFSEKKKSNKKFQYFWIDEAALREGTTRTATRLDSRHATVEAEQKDQVLYGTRDDASATAISFLSVQGTNYSHFFFRFLIYDTHLERITTRSEKRKKITSLNQHFFF